MKLCQYLLACMTHCLPFVLAACTSSSPSSSPGQQATDTTQPTFTTPQQAAQQGKQDLLDILRMHPETALGITDTGLLSRSAPGQPIPQEVLDFQQLLTTDSAVSFSQFRREQAHTLVPLMADGRLVTIVTLASENDQWKVSALAGKAMGDDLQVVLQAASRYMRTGEPVRISLVEVPNLQARLFVVEVNDTEMVFTPYNGFSLREAVPVAAVVRVLHRDAVEFQKQYGDQLKRARLTE